MRARAEELGGAVEPEGMVDLDAVEPLGQSGAHSLERGLLLDGPQHGVVGIGNKEAVARGLERELGLLPARCETDEHDPSVSVDVVEGRIVDSKAVAVSEG
jgi:hypothetical protein